jgi:hypothetical protein
LRATFFVALRAPVLRAVDFFVAVFRAGDLRAVDVFAAVFRAPDFFEAAFFVAARRGCLALGPDLAPPSCLFTVAQARRSASSLDTPRSS